MLSVVLFHAGLPIPGGFLGVDIFFTISGFVITQLILREWLESRKFSLKNFYRRRFKRLLPAMALMTTSVAILSVLILGQGAREGALKSGIGATLFVANFVINAITGGYFDLPAATNPMLHTWSLSIEEQFYLFFPLTLTALLAWAIRSKLRTRSVMIPLLALGITSFFIMSLSHAFYSPLTRIWEFLVGALVAIALADGLTPNPRSAKFLYPIALLILISSFFLIDEVGWPNWHGIIPVLATGVLLYFGQISNFSWPLKIKVMTYIGDRSYSWYLWHWPIMVFAALLFPSVNSVKVIALFISLLVAQLAYRFVEDPIRKSSKGNSRDWKINRRAIAIPLLVSIAAMWVATFLPQSSQALAINADVAQEHLGRTYGCHNDIPIDQRDLRACTWKGSATPLYLIGDSQADALSDGLLAAADTHPLTIATISSCPIGINLRALDGAPVNRDEKRCLRYSKGALSYFKKAIPGIIYIATTDQYWRESNYALIDGKKIITNKREKLAAISNALTQFIGQVEKVGYKVVLIQTVPQFNYAGANSSRINWNPRSCTTIELKNDSCAISKPLPEVIQVQGAGWQMLSQVAKSTNSTLLDFTPEICPKNLCQTFRDGNWIYRDANHLSVFQSKALEFELRNTFNK